MKLKKKDRENRRQRKKKLKKWKLKNTKKPPKNKRRKENGYFSLPTFLLFIHFLKIFSIWILTIFIARTNRHMQNANLTRELIFVLNVWYLPVMLWYSALTWRLRGLKLLPTYQGYSIATSSLYLQEMTEWSFLKSCTCNRRRNIDPGVPKYFGNFKIWFNGEN